MIENENYIVIQGFMINELQLKGNELLIYAIIYGFSQNGGVFTGSSQYLAEWTNSTKQGVFKVLKNLVEKDLLIREEVKNKGVKYVNYKTVVNKVDRGSKQSLLGVVNKVDRGSKQSLLHNIDNNIIHKLDNNINDDFVEFWNLYPRKVNKANAEKSYKKAINKVNHNVIIDGLKKYIKEITEKQIKIDYVAHASTWLNGERWNDFEEKKSEDRELLIERIKKMTGAN